MAIVVWGVLVHGLILFNPIPYWDGWLVYGAERSGDYSSLYRLFASSGVPTGFLVHWVLGHLGGVFAYRVAALCAQIVAGLAVYDINRQEQFLTRGEGLLLALLAVAYPAVHVSFELIISPYEISYALFLVAACLALRSEHQGRAGRLFLRLAALLALFFSFGINSLLVFYFALLWLLLLRFAHERSVTIREALAPFSRTHVDYIALPFVFWALKTTFFAPLAGYGDYYRIKLSPVAIGYQVLQHLISSVWEPLNGALPAAVSESLGCAMMVVLVAYLFQMDVRTESRSRPCDVAVFGVALLALGIAPYVLIGGHATPTGWSSRHALLTSLPVCILLLAGARFAGARNGGHLPAAWVWGLTILAGGFSVLVMNNYLQYQARAAKDQAVIAFLASHPDLANGYSTFWVDDGIPFGADTYRPYEWSSLMKEAWHDEAHVGLDLAAIPHDRSMTWLSDIGVERRHYFNLDAYDPGGRAARMTLRKGAYWVGVSTVQVGIEHIFNSYIHRDRLHGWLEGLVDVRVEPDSPDRPSGSGPEERKRPAKDEQP